MNTFQNFRKFKIKALQLNLRGNWSTILWTFKKGCGVEAHDYSQVIHLHWTRPKSLIDSGQHGFETAPWHPYLSQTILTETKTAFRHRSGHPAPAAIMLSCSVQRWQFCWMTNVLQCCTYFYIFLCILVKVQTKSYHWFSLKRYF